MIFKILPQKKKKKKIFKMLTKVFVPTFYRYNILEAITPVVLHTIIHTLKKKTEIMTLIKS